MDHTPADPHPMAALAALLVFGVGLAFAAFLWWLAARSFALLRDPRTTPEQLASLRDLPLALPEGTVRALLALIVGVVGLPLLLFSQTLGLRDAVAGYVNGIIAGVFGYYFGARGSAGEAQATRRASDALATQVRANDALRTEAAGAEQRGALPGKVGQALEAVQRHIAIAETVAEVLGPALPKGVLPDGAAEALRRARDAVKAAEAAPTQTVLDALQGALSALTGSGGPFPALLRAAGVALPVVGGPLGAAALLLGLGWQAGSATWRRWRAQVLAAPHDPTLFEPGGITPTSAALRLAEVPALAPLSGEPALLLDLALREDGAAQLWSQHGALFASPEAAADALRDFRRALLAEEAGADITAPTVAALGNALAAAAPALRPGDADDATARAVLAAAGAEPHPAVQALALLTAEMRERKLDAVRAMQELTP